MSSGNAGVSGLDRIVKLWISLWNLVLEGKRHYESVCAVLQRLVFESSSWPRYKDWPIICELGRYEPLMMMTIATLDLSKTDDRLTQNIIAAFPQCFSDKEVRGPVPWSMMLDHTAKKSDRHEPDFMSIYGTIGYFGLPHLVLSDDPDIRSRDDSVLPFPDDFCHKDSPIGTIMEFMGKRYVIVENRSNGFNYGDPDMTLVPAECIALDL